MLCLIATFVLIRIDNIDQKKHMDKYADSHMKKIEILESVLIMKFNINTKEKITNLIDIYNEYVDRRVKDEKKRNRIIVSICSAFASVLTISFENMGVLGVNLSTWMVFAVFLIFCLAVSVIWINAYTYFDSMKSQYEMMIKDLKELLIMTKLN